MLIMAVCGVFLLVAGPWLDEVIGKAQERRRRRLGLPLRQPPREYAAGHGWTTLRRGTTEIAETHERTGFVRAEVGRWADAIRRPHKVDPYD